MPVVEAEDLKSAILRLLGKLPPLETFKRVPKASLPSLEIQAGNQTFMAFAADVSTSRFYGAQVGTNGSMRPGAFGEFQIDPDGQLVLEGEALRIRRMDFEDGPIDTPVPSWKPIARPK